MTTQRVKLSDRYAKYIERAVTQGRFTDASEAVNKALQLLEEQDKHEKAKLKQIRKLVKEGFDEIDRGEYTVVTKESLGGFLDSLRTPKPSRKSA